MIPVFTSCHVSNCYHCQISYHIAKLILFLLKECTQINYIDTFSMRLLNGILRRRAPDFKRINTDRCKHVHCRCSVALAPGHQQPCHDDVIIWKHFPRHWPFVRGIHRWPVNSPHKGQWRGALMFSLICVRTNGLVNNREAGDLRRHRSHYDVTVMVITSSCNMTAAG